MFGRPAIPSRVAAVAVASLSFSASCLSQAPKTSHSCKHPAKRKKERKKTWMEAAVCPAVYAAVTLTQHGSPARLATVHVGNEWAFKIYIHLPAASPLSNTSSAGSIGTDCGGAGQWDSSYWHDTSRLSSSVHSS